MIRDQFDYLADCRCLQTHCVCVGLLWIASICYLAGHYGNVEIYYYISCIKHRFLSLLKLSIASQRSLTYTQGKDTCALWRLMITVCRCHSPVFLSYMTVSFSVTYVKHTEVIMRFRTVMPCVSIWYMLSCAFMKFIFAFLWHFLIDALRFRNTAVVVWVDSRYLYSHCFFVGSLITLNLPWCRLVALNL